MKQNIFFFTLKFLSVYTENEFLCQKIHFGIHRKHFQGTKYPFGIHRK